MVISQQGVKVRTETPPPKMFRDQGPELPLRNLPVVIVVSDVTTVLLWFSARMFSLPIDPLLKCGDSPAPS